MSRGLEARREFIAGLRAVADFYETRPGAYYDGMTVTISMYVAGRRAPRAFAAMAAALRETRETCERGEARDSGKTAGSEEPRDCIEAAELVRLGSCAMACAGTHAVLAASFSAKVRLEIFARRVRVCPSPPGCLVPARRGIFGKWSWLGRAAGTATKKGG